MEILSGKRLFGSRFYLEEIVSLETYLLEIVVAEILPDGDMSFSKRTRTPDTQPSLVVRDQHVYRSLLAQHMSECLVIFSPGDEFRLVEGLSFKLNSLNSAKVTLHLGRST